MKKFLSLIGILFIVSLMFVPLVSASYVCPAALTSANGEISNYYLSNEHPSTNTYKSVVGVAFTANATTYIYNVTFSALKVGSPTGSLTARLYAAAGTVGSNAYPTGVPLSNSFVLWSDDLIGSFAEITFTFDGTYEMTSGYDYVVVVEATSTEFSSSNYVKIGLHFTDNASFNGVYYASGTWVALAYRDLNFVVNGDTTEYAGATPTPSPTPTAAPGGSGDADMEALTAAILPFLVPLLVCLIPALLGYKFVGELGFFIGLNVGCILAYVTLAGTAYAFPLWGIILVGVMDVAVVLMRR